MWLKKINQGDNGYEFRYELQTFYTEPLMLADGSQTQCFMMYKYWRDNNGEFQLCKSDAKILVSIETLLSQFIQIDSQVDNTLKNLQEFKDNTQAKNLEDSLAPFYLGDTQEINGNNLDISLEPQGSN